MKERIRNFPGKQPRLSLLLSILLVEVFGASGSVFVTPNLDWYTSLNLPSIAPPGSFIGLVWTVLFALMGWAVWRVWRKVSGPEEVSALATFAVHFVFNIGWSAAFFGSRSPAAGLYVIGLLWVLVAATALRFRRIDQTSARLLIPYLAWVSFAAFLNLRIYVLNS